jgi:muconate cycloisomerase
MYEVVVPARAGAVNTEDYGPIIWDRKPKWIIQVQTDEGITGYGESKIDTPRQAIEHAIHQLAGVDLMEACLQQLPLSDLEHNELFTPYPAPHPPRAIEVNFNSVSHLAVQLAVYDLVGKRLGRPLHALLGGAFRRRVSVDAWMGRMSPDDSARAAQRAREHGFCGIKLKAALDDPVVERTAAVRHACGENFAITVDPNERFYRPADAMPTIRALARLGNITLEDPFPKSRLQWYSDLRRLHLLPIALHLNYGPVLIDAIRAEACDYINLHHCPWDIKRAGDVCFAAGIPTWHGTGIDLGLIEASALHVCAATQSMTRPSDIYGRFIREHNLITDPFQPCDGAMAVPSGPGLGVELDADAMDHYCINKYQFALS